MIHLNAMIIAPQNQDISIKTLKGGFCNELKFSSPRREISYY